MTIYEILDDIRRNSISQADKGLRFEVLIHNYFLTDKVYANDITDVWLWSEFPFLPQNYKDRFIHTTVKCANCG